jgi:hypothetical protein
MSVLHAQVQRLVEDGLSHQEIEQHLVGQGHPPEQVRKVVGSYSGWIDELQQREVRNEGYATGSTGSTAWGPMGNIMLGLLLLGLGLLSLGTSRIFIGAMLVGVFRLARGLAGLAQER